MTYLICHMVRHDSNDNSLHLSNDLQVAKYLTYIIPFNSHTYVK